MSRLNEKIIEYYTLLQQKQLLERRLNGLNEAIKKEIVEEASEMAPGQTLQKEADGYTASVQIKRVRAKVDEGALAQLIVDKNLWAEATRVKVDHDLVEQLYIEGKITDSDLRSINGGADIQLALKVVPNV